MLNVNVGDEVRVFDLNDFKGNRTGQPEGGWPGVVIEVAPELVVAYENGPEAFSPADGRCSHPHRLHVIETLEQAEADTRRRVALDVLRSWRIVLKPRHKLTLEQMEALAEVARTFASQEEEG